MPYRKENENAFGILLLVHYSDKPYLFFDNRTHVLKSISIVIGLSKLRNSKSVRTGIFEMAEDGRQLDVILSDHSLAILTFQRRHFAATRRFGSPSVKITYTKTGENINIYRLSSRSDMTNRVRNCARIDTFRSKIPAWRCADRGN